MRYLYTHPMVQKIMVFNNFSPKQPIDGFLSDWRKDTQKQVLTNTANPSTMPVARRKPEHV